MNSSRRLILEGGAAGLLASAWALDGCAVHRPPVVASAETRRALAPAGTLRVGVALDDSVVSAMDSSGHEHGLARQLGLELARWLDVPAEVTAFDDTAVLLRALQAGQIDFSLAQVHDEAARMLDFSLPLLNLELGVLVAGSVKPGSVHDLDLSAMKVAVLDGEPARAQLIRRLSRAHIVPVPSMGEARRLMQRGGVDGLASTKAVLSAVADAVPHARLLDGALGYEPLAITLPRGRQAGMAYLSSFSLAVRRDGTLGSMLRDAGLRGYVDPDVH